MAGQVAADVVSVFASADSWIRGRSDLALRNFGGQNSASAYTDEPTRSLVNFDLPAEISGKTINSAILRLHIFGAYNQLHPLDVRRITHPWNEGAGMGQPGTDDWIAVDWWAYDYTVPGQSSSQLAWPGGGGVLGDSVSENPAWTPPHTVGYAGTGTFFDIPVTNSIQSAAYGLPFEGFLIKFVDEGQADDDWFMFWTKESVNTPSELIIDYGGTIAGFVNRKATLAPNLLDGHVAFADFNDDGRTDMYAGGSVWRNDGASGFTKLFYAGEDYGLWADVDNDNRPDLYVVDQLDDARIFRNDGSDNFTQLGFPTLPTTRTRGACFGDFDEDALVDLYIGGYEHPSYTPDSIFTNNGSFSFTNTWTQSGDIDPARGITTADFDEDGDLDIYVSNYRLEANLLLRNDGQGNFTNVAADFGVAGIYNGSSATYGHTIGSCWGDLDSDGHLDLFVGNFSHSASNQDRPRFYRNMGPAGDYHFEDVSDGAGLPWQESYASPALGDFDNDGYLDIYYTVAWESDDNVLYRNNGNWTFTNVTNAVGLDILSDDTYQSARADLNNDGHLDLVTDGNIFINEGNDNHWLKVTLKGNGASVNTSAIGAQARIDLGGGKIITRQVEAGTGEGNQNDLTLHFGLGQHDSPVNVDIVWPDGLVTQIPNVAVDQHIMATMEILTCLDAINSGYGLAADFNKDCYVEWADFGILAGQWMKCIDPSLPQCDPPF